jgi:serine/threonine protein kinase
MGEVYRARDTRLDRTVAIKILPAVISADPIAKQRFEREAKTISSLNHPNICVLHDVGSQDSIEYLVMECVDGDAGTGETINLRTNNQDRPTGRKVKARKVQLQELSPPTGSETTEWRWVKDIIAHNHGPASQPCSGKSESQSALADCGRITGKQEGTKLLLVRRQLVQNRRNRYVPTSKSLVFASPG